MTSNTFVDVMSASGFFLEVCASAESVTAVTFIDEAQYNVHHANPNAITQEACAQLKDYFAGTLQRFSVPVAPGGTAFQQRVWTQLVTVNYAQTASYGQIACALGQPTGSRAVGMANGRNPIAIIIPCHRIIGSNGKLTGYAGGLSVKAWLLAHEAQHAQFSLDGFI
jgi:methylated-DNA-[protein]-cysteine S-methyltransferase